MMKAARQLSAPQPDVVPRHSSIARTPPRPSLRLAAANNDGTEAGPSASEISSWDDHARSPMRTHQVDRRALLVSACLGYCFPISPAQASKLPAFVDSVWETLGGGPSDLVFPDSFHGVWTVTSVLKQVELPLGEAPVADMQVVKRAQSEIDQPITYQVAFTRNSQQQVVFDRAYNTAALLHFYYARPVPEFLSRINWNIDDPNVLELSMPGGLEIRTRVTRRSEETPAPDRIETSEFIEQVFDSSGMSESSSPAPRLKVSQCFTKYKFRNESNVPSGQPSIVATQVVSDFVSPVSGKELLAVQAGNRPITTYTYRMAFVRADTVVN